MQENSKKKMIYSGIILSFIVVFYFLFSSETKLTNDSKKSKTESGSDLVSLLNSGGSKREVDENGIVKNSGESVFESDFYKSGNLKFEDEGKEEHYMAQGEIPINPQTGQPYSESAMKQFEELAKKMLGNELIPRRVTPEQKEAKAQEAARLREITAKVNNATASREEVNQFYDSQAKTFQDRLQIVKYLIELQEEGGEEDKDGKFKKVLDGTNEQLRILEQRRNDSLKRFQ
ncbi:MAG: hypothetical protein H7A25_07450 [Leptospiraceae bacterium]|nr:hypothetical protein [Leptospiraceae bacterium]MCP5499720.1 hypothetical protein [Leptospiraceae bacterium]